MDGSDVMAMVRSKIRYVTKSENDLDLPVGLTTCQAAKVLGRDSKTLYNWSSKPQIAPIQPRRDAQGRLYWLVEDVERVLTLSKTTKALKPWKGVPDMAIELLVAAGHVTQDKVDESLRLASALLGEK